MQRAVIKPDKFVWIIFKHISSYFTENIHLHSSRRIQSVPHRKHIKSPLQSPTGYYCLGKQSLFTVRTIRNTQIYKNSVRTSQETHYVSSTKSNRLMLFRETVAVYCETIRNTQIYKNAVRSSQETHYVSATKPNRLMLFRETVAVYCENHTEHTDI
jgi:hypothetical protein